jgi:hypothetical protein
MPTSKKISELPTFSTVQAADILPIVDYTLTQTGKCTASQIAAIGGGPPGVGTINDTMIIDGGILPQDIGFTAQERMVCASANTTTAFGAVRYKGEQATLTSWARGFLSSVSAEVARGYMEALQSSVNAYFQGQTRFGGSVVSGGSGNTAAIPCIVKNPANWSTSNLQNSGIFFPDDDAVAFSINGQERWRIQDDGGVWTALQNTSPIVSKPGFMCRAFVFFSGTATAGSQTSITANQRAVAARYGLAGTLASNSATETKIAAIESARGITLDLNSTDNFTDAYGKGSFPIKNRGTESRANYTSPGDNKHWSWNTSTNDWVLINAINGSTNVPWIGTAAFTTQLNNNPIFCSANIASVQRTSAGVYQLNFSVAMPTPNSGAGTPEGYAVLLTTSDRTFTAQVTARADTSLTVTTYNSSGAAADVGGLSVAVFR